MVCLWFVWPTIGLRLSVFSAPFASPPQGKNGFSVLTFMHLLKGVRMYEIDKSVPLPKEKVRHEYPHEQLQVGESFLVHGGNTNI